MSKNAWGRTSRFVYVGGLNYYTKEKDIIIVFRKFGHIRAITMKKGFCFVEFENCEDADQACYNMNNRVILGSHVKVEITWGSPRGRDRERSANLLTFNKSCPLLKKTFLKKKFSLIPKLHKAINRNVK